MNILDRVIKDIALAALRLKTMNCVVCGEEEVVYWEDKIRVCTKCSDEIREGD